MAFDIQNLNGRDGKRRARVRPAQDTRASCSRQDLGMASIEPGQHGTNMRPNPRGLCFRDQLLGFFPGLLHTLIDHHILPDADNKFSAVCFRIII